MTEEKKAGHMEVSEEQVICAGCNAPVKRFLNTMACECTTTRWIGRSEALVMKSKELPASIDGDGEQFGFPLTAEGIEETRQLCGLIDAETAEQFIRAMAKMWGCSPGFAAHHIKQDKRTEAAEARAATASMGDDGLREALIDIRNRILCPVGPSPTLDEVEEIASAALARTSSGTDGGSAL